MIHGLWGLSWGEILSLATLIGVVTTALSKLLKKGMSDVLSPLRMSLNELNDNLKTLNSNFHKQEVEIDKINDSLRRHDLKLVEHETEIHALKEDTNALYNANRTLNR
ncbi:hypothetical protein [Ligilactobacillus ruminis]|uniref:Uncharacterized protein n=3 Tax=Ligilactobacillus ruminis TaxID=1623 RepID=A0A837IT33_9LACO|nr:hypothetical protein [Ligilactobacillus ruminis]KLA47034.1 hypothetical protein LRB_477 [Ligilactobacillus ruminis]SFG40809.1 hypothetical protein SAMN02910432_01229 [Ligilactobacillus ruminis DSM 20403 = NBRC 102161]